MAGLHAVGRRVEPQQTIAVGLRDVVVPVFLDRVVARIVVRKIPDQRCGERIEIARRAVVLGVGQSGGVDETRVLHPETLRLTVHQLHEHVLRAGDRLGERNAGIVARLYFHALDELLHRDRAARLDEHARARRAPGAHRHRHLLLERELLVAQRREHEIGRHQLGERGRLEALIRALRDEHLAARQVADDPRLAHDARRRRRRGMGLSADEESKQENEADHQHRQSEKARIISARARPARSPRSRLRRCPCR